MDSQKTIFNYLLLIVVLFLLVNIVEKSNFIADRRARLGGYPLGSYDFGSHSYADSVVRNV